MKKLLIILSVITLLIVGCKTKSTGKHYNSRYLSDK
jgi:uncharacterized protein YcfL